MESVTCKKLTHLNLPQCQLLHVVTIKKYVLNNIAQSIIEVAGEPIDKASRNLISKCRSDDENNEIYPENYI